MANQPDSHKRVFRDYLELSLEHILDQNLDSYTNRRHLYLNTCQPNLLKTWSLVLFGCNLNYSESIQESGQADGLDSLSEWDQALKTYTQNQDLNQSPITEGFTKLYNSLGSAIWQQIRPSLVGVHIRSANVKKGRMSASLDRRFIYGEEERPYENSWRFHEELLKVYFDIYGRSRTFNEFVFNRLSAEKNVRSSLLTIEFLACLENNMLLCIESAPVTKRLLEETTIRISKDLQDRLLPKSLQSRFFDVILDNGRVNPDLLPVWHPLLCTLTEKSSSLVIDLAECVEDAYCYFTSNSDNKSQWSNLLKFMSPKEEFLENLKWSRQTRHAVRNILKSLQGICLYQFFANSSITTLAIEGENGAAIGMTLGFDCRAENGQNKYFFDVLHDILYICKESAIAVPYQPDKHPNNTDNDIWMQKGLKYKAPTIFRKLRFLYNALQPICFAVHEGLELSFTAYIGNQIMLNKFRYISELEDKEIRNYNGNGNWADMVKAHYSLFLDGRTGLFFDESSDDHVALVQPLVQRDIPEKQIFSLDDEEQITTQLINNEYWTNLSKSSRGMAIFSIARGELVIFFKGKRIFEYSKRTGLRPEWLDEKNSKFIGIGFENVYRYLLEKIMINLPDKLQKYKHSSAHALSRAICHISETPGYGSMVVFIKSKLGTSQTGKMLEGKRTELNPDLQMSYWKNLRLYEHTAESLIAMMIPDGSFLIDLDTLRIENQIYLVPINQEGKVVNSSAERGKGTRHRAAQSITQINQEEYSIWSVCVSSDGGISVYSKGKKISLGNKPIKKLSRIPERYIRSKSSTYRN